jgi:predicted RNase H-like HicB family nuclease
MRREREFDFTVWQDDGQWTAHSPAVPGVYGIGATRAGAERDLRDGLRDLFDYLTDIGEPLPAPGRVRVGTVRV